jgi:molecular chaperone DnaK
MSTTIDYGIDLGTTNSVIAKFTHGKVEVLKDPLTWQETLPSVVGFRKGRILVGKAAQTYLPRNPENVVSRFKRRMGTGETFEIESLGESLSPVQLSAHVLRALKTHVQDGGNIGSAVITVPASFDIVQSNATIEAGREAGFAEVLLLQEPIAASLAYANLSNVSLENTSWLVYDLGGGTFDVALLRNVNGELRVVDHEGDNFLGGSDLIG